MKNITKRLDLASWRYALLFDCSTVDCDKCDFSDCLYKNE